MKLIAALEMALSLKSKETRTKTVQTYSSFLNMFIKYWLDLKNKNSLLDDFRKKDAIHYLDYVLITKGVSPITRNNYLTTMRTLFYVLVDREYIDKNPFAGIKKLKVGRKRRQVFEPGECNVICNYLKGRNDGLLLAISLCYYCALRPAEIRRLKIQDVDLTKGIITLDGTETKNKDLAHITMPNHLIEFCQALNIKRHPSDYFIIGEQMQPNPTQCGKNTMTRMHREVLQELAKYNLLEDIENKTFYSWKDTAARDMIEEGVNAAALMKHFRHASLETTQKYLESFGVKNNRIKELKSKIF